MSVRKRVNAVVQNVPFIIQRAEAEFRQLHGVHDVIFRPKRVKSRNGIVFRSSENV